MAGLKKDGDLPSKICMDSVDDNTLAGPRAPNQDCPVGEKSDLGIEDVLPFAEDSYSQIGNALVQSH